MILDTGIATFYHQQNTALNGAKPVMADIEYYQGYFGELSFETNPAYPTDRREDVKTDAKIRVLNNRAITNHDRVMLQPFDGPSGFYEITRGYHGVDDDSGELISDLSLTRLDTMPVTPGAM